ncbi:MAG: hypothetical protein ACJ8DZ_09045 [Allosphingosinicella sp.]
MAQMPSESAGSGPEDPKAFILTRARSEVHLLLDYLSACPDNTISSLSLANPPAGSGLPADWIEKVCQITWPPRRGGATEAEIGEEADQAALLLKARDYLNSLAEPASGTTIAFTLLVTQEESGERRRHRREEATGPVPSRSSLAADAYPDLVPRARQFRRHLRLMTWVPAAWLIVTVLLSWYLVIGNAALGDYSEAVLATTRVAADTNGFRQEAAASKDPLKRAVAAKTGAGLPCDPAAAAAANPAAPAAAPAGPCPDLSAEGQRNRAERGLRNWTFGLGDHATASWLAALLGSAVLPVLYGFVGAAAAVVRALSSRMRASLLSPRDMQLSVQQLVLGAVIGACISLFVGGPDTDPNSTLFGPVALSASAVSFVAGFGVESVFQALEAVIKRVFNLTPAPTDRVPSPRDPG